ncbi:MAG: penicillin acylase family protein [Candidatus Binatia bacterium]
MQTTRRALKSGIAVLAIAFSACGGGGPAANPVEQVPVNETIELPSLPATADVIVDELGVPHVFASDLESAVFVQGYITAAARFWEMDVFRRLAEGRLSEVFGKLSLSTDVAMRTVFTTREGLRLEEVLWKYVQEVDPELARIERAYTAGINAWLGDLRAGRNGATLPPEYELGIIIDRTAEDLAPWRPQDTVAIGRLQAWQLSQTLDQEMERARIVASLPDAIVRDVFRSAPATNATVLPVRQARSVGHVFTVLVPPRLPSIETLDAVCEALAALRHTYPLGSMDKGLGSNNWVVSPALSANGHAMLANDPHLQLFNPPIWHMIQLDAGPDGRANGVIFPGLPGVILGHNDFGAWGATVANFDVTDVYVEEVTTPPDYPNSPRTVLFNGRQVPVLRVEETFQVKDSEPVIEVIEVVPHHGPMVPDPNLRDDVVGLAATGMSFRWTGHEISNDARFLLDLNRARNVSEFRAALRNFAVGAQNWVWADVNGDIAYFPRVLIPQRPTGTVPYLPLPGTGEAEWLVDDAGDTLWLPEDRIPQATNPPQGFLATANNDQIGNTLDNDPLNDPVYLAFSYDLGLREERIQELLSNRTNVRPKGAKLNLDDMARYQYDHASKEAARLLPFLFRAAEARPDLMTAEMGEALNRLRAWGEAKPGSAAYDTASGIDAHDCCAPLIRDDVAPRSAPVTAEERSDAVATSIFAAWETRLGPAVFTDDFAGTRIRPPGGQDATKALLHILEDIDRTDVGFRVYTKGTNGESTLWDRQETPEVETQDEVLLAALRDGLAFLRSKFSSADPDTWLWGIIHRVRLQHFIGQAGIGIFDLGPFAAVGARFTVNPANYSLNANDFTFSNGPSERFVAVLDPAGIRAVNTLPGGNNGNPGGTASERFHRINPSIHYGDLTSAWINGDTFEYHISRADVAAHAMRKVRYVP